VLPLLPPQPATTTRASNGKQGAAHGGRIDPTPRPRGARAGPGALVGLVLLVRLAGSSTSRDFLSVRRSDTSSRAARPRVTRGRQARPRVTRGQGDLVQPAGAMMLHARNLIRFLFAVDGQSYSQENFVSGWKPTGDAAERLKDVLPILHQHFAHPNPRRLKPKLPREHFRQYRDRLPYDVLEVMSDFVKIAQLQESSVAGSIYAAVETARLSLENEL